MNFWQQLGDVFTPSKIEPLTPAQTTAKTDYTFAVGAGVVLVLLVVLFYFVSKK